MNQNVKDLFDGFMTTFCRSEDVIIGNEPRNLPKEIVRDILSQGRSFKILKEDYIDEPDYTPFEIGKSMGNLLNTHELLSKTSKILMPFLEDAGAEIKCGWHIKDLKDGFTRYKLEVVLEP